MARGTILIADDDTAIRTVLNQALARAGYAPRATGNAATLWRWVSQGEGDVVITDVVMPDENAFDMIPRIKKLRPDLPIIVMSAQNTLMTALTAAEKGAYEYLPKPFDLSELVAIVGRALAEPGRKAHKAAPDGDGEELPLIGRSGAMSVNSPSLTTPTFVSAKAGMYFDRGSPIRIRPSSTRLSSSIRIWPRAGF